MLPIYLDRARAEIELRLLALTDSQATRCPVAGSGLSVAGIVKHLAWQETFLFHVDLAHGDWPPPWSEAPSDEPDWPIHSARNDSVTELLDLYRDSCRLSREALRAVRATGSIVDRRRAVRSMRQSLTECAFRIEQIDYFVRATDAWEATIGPCEFQ